jgi:hypothetical protein
MQGSSKLTLAFMPASGLSDGRSTVLYFHGLERMVWVLDLNKADAEAVGVPLSVLLIKLDNGILVS